MEYVDLDAARAELADVDGFGITIGGHDYEFPASMNGDAYLRWNEALIGHIDTTGLSIADWKPEAGIPPDLIDAWLEAALSPDRLQEMRDDGLSIAEINAAAEYLYMRYLGVPTPDGDGEGTEANPLTSLQRSS